MLSLANYKLDDVATLQGQVQAALRDSETLQGAAQRCAGAIYEGREESLALVRVYATVPFGQLPPADRAFAAALAPPGRDAPPLAEDTPVLSLLGTCGGAAGWNDRRDSKGHLGIPLVASGFVEAIPMVAQLMHDMGLGLGWLDTRDTQLVVKTLGRVAGVFYVREAAERVDERGRKIVPAQDFVREHGVRTVFGLGGSYLNGTCLILILFTREIMEREEVERFLPLVSSIKSLTVGLVMSDALYERRA